MSDNDVNSREENKENNNKNDQTLLFRQLFVTSGLWTYCFLFGLNLGAPTVIIPQIRPLVNTTFAITTEMESWISSMIGFAGLPWIFIVSVLNYAIGRRRTCFLISATSLSGFIIFYCSTSVTQLLIYQIVQGPIAASQICVTILVGAEYISPSYRGVFLTLNAAALFWGVWTANAIGTFTHWRNIALLGIMCSLYSTIGVFFWPESPYWLAVGRQKEECAKSHRWLKGHSERSEKELADLLKMSGGIRSSKNSILASIKGHTRDFFTAIRLPEVYKAIGLSFLIMNMYHLTGKIICTMYSIDMIKKLANSEFAAYVGMLLIDGVTVIGMYCGCFMMKTFKRKLLFLVTCILTIIFLLILSLYSYLINLGVLTENMYVTISLLIGFSLAVSFGPISFTPVMLGELLPLKSRSACVCILSFYTKSLLSVMLKITPFMFRTLNYYGVFLFFAMVSSVGLLLLYKYLPETKDKTLSEISEILKGPQKEVDGSTEVMLVKVYNNTSRVTSEITTSENTLFTKSREMCA